jgi:hypothetical protein
MRLERMPGRSRVAATTIVGHEEVRTELDNHADTCVVGDGTCLVTHDFGKTVSVHGYAPTVGATTCKVVTAVIAYDDPTNGQVWMLTIHQAILIPEVVSNLLGTMQVRDNGVLINDQPKYQAVNPTNDHHSIFIPSDNEHDSLRIPLRLHGVTHYFTSRVPTVQEYESTEPHYCVTLTAEAPDWDPTEDRFEHMEDAMLDSQGQLREYTLSPLCASPSWAVAAVWCHPHEREPHYDFPSVLASRVMQDRPDESGISLVHSSKRRKAVGPKIIAKNWNIGLAAAERTHKATSQNALRTVLHPTLSRRFRTNDRQLRYRRIPHEMFTDTMEASVRSWFRQNKYAQVYCTRFGWARAYPMKKKSQAHETFSLLAQRDGVPTKLIFDGSKEQNLGEFRKKVKETGTHTHTTLPYSPWSNAAEGAIRELKKGAGRKAAKAHSPAKLWDHCLELEAYIRSHTAHDIYELQGEVPETLVTGQPSDISPFVEQPWYGWVKFWDMTQSFPDQKEVYGRWLGPSIDVGPAMTSKILKDNGQVIHSASYRNLNEDELQDPTEQAMRDAFDASINDKLGDAFTDDEAQDLGLATPEYEAYEDDFQGTPPFTRDAEDLTPELADNYLGAEVILPFQGTMRAGKVCKRARDEEGELYGHANNNPILDTRMYQVEFPDGSHAEYAANVIAESMYAQCDPAGNQYMLLRAIIDHKQDETAVNQDEQWVTVNGRQHMVKTTKGWKLCVEFKDGSTSWVRLAELKESFPVETAEYAVAVGIDNEPAFRWWVPQVLKTRDRIISAVKSRYHKRTHKFGIEVPKTVERALQIDKENGNTLWADAIAKEMKNVGIAFKVLEDDTKVPVGYEFMQCHIIFDIKIDGFKRKARMVAGGHMLDAPAVSTYSSVVSRETVRIALTLAALNDLDVKSSDIQNAYLCAPCEEKVYTVLGPEFGADVGKKALIVRALYGLKSAGASFSRHLADCMRNIGYTPCKADPDLWYKAAVRPDDGFKYYAYVLLYVDDVLAIGHDAEDMIYQLDKFFMMKDGSIGDPDIYLGSKLRKVVLDNGVWCWSMSPTKYVQDAVRNVEEYLQQHSLPKLKNKTRGPWLTDYVSELDVTPELDRTRTQFYQSQIGVLHWIVELGRIDIVTEVSKLAAHMALPREGHLEAVFHVFAYLKCKHNARMVFDPCYPDIDINDFKTDVDWTEFYGNVEEPIPLDAPVPRGKAVDIRLYVDADFAGDKSTRRSRSGFIMYLNSAPISWLSKKQTTIETSVFGAEFVAMKQGVETIRGLRYKLRMMGVALTGPAFVYGDNMSVIHNTSKPASTLKKKSNSVCYHFVRESAAMEEILVGHVPSVKNPADIATKLIPAGMKRDGLVSLILHDISDYD